MAEVEQALERHPSVREAVVVGYPDEIYDERIGAFVVVDRSGAGVPLDRASWVEWFATVGVARYKVPDRVVVVDEIPVLPTFQKPDRASCDGGCSRKSDARQPTGASAATSKPNSAAALPPTMAASSSSGTPANWSSATSCERGHVPSGCG